MYCYTNVGEANVHCHTHRERKCATKLMKYP